jgi:hypothetical protein
MRNEAAAEAPSSEGFKPGSNYEQGIKIADEGELWRTNCKRVVPGLPVAAVSVLTLPVANCSSTIHP